MKVLDRQVFDRGGPSHVQAFLHAVLFPSVRLLVVHPQQTRSRTLTVAVTHPFFVVAILYKKVASMDKKRYKIGQKRSLFDNTKVQD